MARARRDKTAFLQLLQKIRKLDIQNRIAESLAAKTERAQKKEGKLRNLAAILKTGTKFLPGAGKLAEFAVDPLLRLYLGEDKLLKLLKRE